MPSSCESALVGIADFVGNGRRYGGHTCGERGGGRVIADGEIPAPTAELRRWIAQRRVGKKTPEINVVRTGDGERFAIGHPVSNEVKVRVPGFGSERNYQRCAIAGIQVK